MQIPDGVPKDCSGALQDIASGRQLNRLVELLVSGASIQASNRGLQPLAEPREPRRRARARLTTTNQSYTNRTGR